MADELDRPANDAILCKYEADRVHELELNKFSHAFEVERLKLLHLLNGGAFVALTALTDLHGLFDGGEATIAVAVAVIAWLIGLGLAFQATQAALDTQVKFAQAYHSRRRATEWRLLAGTYSTTELERIVSPPPAEFGGEFDAAFDNKASAMVEAGRTLGAKVRRLAKASVGAFILGGIALLVALALRP